MSRRLACFFLVAIATLLLAACGDDGGTSTTEGAPGITGVTNGVAVDPYIVGAVFEEVAADGKILQPASTASNDVGQFTFPKGLTPGSIVRLKISQPGTHAGVPFEGMLKRRVLNEDIGQVVVNPLTTLVANGMTPADVSRLLSDAGFQVSPNQVYSNPMLELDGSRGQVGDTQLEKLHANMAVNALLQANGNYDMGPNELNDAGAFEILQEFGQAVKGMLNTTELNDLTTQFATDASLTEPLQLNDLIRSTVDQVRDLAQKTHAQMQANGGQFDRTQFASDLNQLKGQLHQVVRNYVQARQDANNNKPPVDGQTVFNDNCSMCHNIGNGGLMDLTGKGSLAQSKISGGHNNRQLATDELAALAAYLDNPGGGSSGGGNSGGNTGGGATPTDGPGLYANNCAACHGDLASSSKAGRSATAIQAAIDNNIGSMGYLTTLSNSEVQLIADALVVTDAGDTGGGNTPVDGPTLYSANCAGCHGDLSNTGKPGRTSTQIQAAIDGDVGGMGYLANLTMQEVQAIADALPAAPPVDPTLPPDGIALYNNECAGCHGNLANTSKPGRTAAEIQAAIDANIGNMGYLSSLAGEEVQAIADALPAPPAPTPGPVDGTTLYGSTCAGCHGDLTNTNKPGRSAAEIQAAIDGDVGGMGYLASLTVEEIQAIADTLPAPPAPTPGPVDGAALYGSNCAGCHGSLASTSKPGRTAAEIQAAIDGNVGGMGYLASLTAEEVQAIADTLPAPPAPTPGPVDGTTLYDSNCAGCHGSLASTSKPGRTAAEIQAAIDGNVGGMGYLASLTAEEVQAIADALPTPAPGPVDGAALYNNNCASCHGSLDNSQVSGSSASKIQNAIDGNKGSMGYLSTLSGAEVQMIADALNGVTTTPPGTTDGAALYASDCAGCHGSLSSSSKAGRSAAAIQGAIDGNVGGMGYLSILTTTEVQAIADALATSGGGNSGGPDYSNCTACHGQPPNGSTTPNTAGAHAAHKALSGVGSDCSICHTGANHNGQVDIGFPAAYDAKSGTATDNMNGQCSNIICHGGKTTPDWWSGSINVDSQCTSCHASGTNAYNSYNSGKHSKHIGKGYACTVCHNTAKMGNHFGDLTTAAFETSPASTIGGGATKVGSYSGSNCSNIQCHGSETWK